MFTCSDEAYQDAVAAAKKKYPGCTIYRPFALAFLSVVDEKKEQMEFTQAVRESLNGYSLDNNERQAYRVLACSLFGKRGAEVRAAKGKTSKEGSKRKKPQRATTREIKRLSVYCVFSNEEPQGVFLFFDPKGG